MRTRLDGEVDAALIAHSGKKSKIKVSMQEKEPGNSVVTFKGDKKNERFGEILQQLEQTLDNSE